MIIIAQAAESAGNGVDGAVIAAWVAAAAALASIPANLWISHKRLERAQVQSDKRMTQEKELHAELLAHEASESKKRLAHERREAVRTVAADAYVKGGLVITRLNEHTVTTIDDRQWAESNHAVEEARRAFAVVAAQGWNAEVRRSAGSVTNWVLKLEHRAHAAVGAVRNKTADRLDTVDRVGATSTELEEVLEEYREAITKD